jgi:S1-C subfamily serine protease
MSDHTRRQVLAATAGVAAGLAGCSAGRREPPAPVERRTAAGDPSSPYTAVYEERIDSVTFVRSDGSSGSGFAYRDVVVTNQHVVAGDDRMDVRFENGDWREATVQATDVYADLAVLSTDVPAYAAPLSFVDAIPPVGTEVVALGSPFGLASSVSTGVISGKNRALPSPSGFAIANTVQTDAGLDPGNSGGPLLTLDGAVTGIAVAGAGTSVGFAVSPLLAGRVLPELLATGTYDHPFIGISLRSVTPAVAEANDLDDVSGVIVVDVLEGGPAGQTLRGSDGRATVDGRSVPTGGDVIVEFAGTRIRSDADLGTTLALELSPGDRVAATVIRDGERREIRVPVGSRPAPDR